MEVNAQRDYVLQPQKDFSNLPERQQGPKYPFIKKNDLNRGSKMKERNSGLSIKIGGAFSSLQTKGRHYQRKRRRNIKDKGLNIFTHSSIREAVLDILSDENYWSFCDRIDEANYIHFKREKGTNYAYGHTHLVQKYS